MMNWLATILIIFVIVLLVGTVFSVGGFRGPWPSMFRLFLIMFLGTLAISVWATPFGPRLWGVPWLEFLVTAMLIAMLIAATTPQRGPKRTHVKELPLQPDTVEEPEPSRSRLKPYEPDEEIVSAATITAFFWVFLVLALGLIFARVFSNP